MTLEEVIEDGNMGERCNQCVLCPNNRKRFRDVGRFPKFYKAYLRTFEKMLENEDSERIFPGESKKRILRVLERIYGSKENQGILVFELSSPTS